MGYIVPYLGIDLGTSNTQIYVRHKGIVIDEPSILVADRNAKRTVRAIGDDARVMLGRTTGESMTVRPLADGLTHDFDMTEEMLRYFVRKAIGASRLFRPRAVMTVPSRITPVERRVLRKAAVSAGIRENQLNLVEKSFAAALGCGLEVFDPVGSMVVDIGGGSTEVAVISLGGIVAGKTIRIGGVKMDEAIIGHIKRIHNIQIGDRTAEEMKISLGSALPLKTERKALVKGRDLITNLPQNTELSSTEVFEALRAPCQAILGAIQDVLSRTPPELAGDVMRKGIHLTGGASQLLGLDQYIASEFGITVRLAKDPLHCAALGVGHLAEHYDQLHRIGRNSFLKEEKEE